MAKVDLTKISMEDLQKRIVTLQGIQEDTGPEEAELKRRQSLPASSAVKTAAVADTGVYEMIPVQVEVDKASFESGGETLEGPGIEGVFDGLVWRYIKANKKDNQEFFIFKTNDERIVAKKGRNIFSAITITPRAAGTTAAGAFNLSRLLTDLNIPYTTAPGSTTTNELIDFDLPHGKPCKLDYQNQTYNQKTEVRLIRAFVGEVQQAI